MAQDQFELDKLKNDPDLWKRLCTYNAKTGQMDHLFKDKENPFTRGGDLAMNRVKEVAGQGNLYMREFGRARHFRKAELQENQVKLGNMREAALNRTSDPFMTGLLWATRGYLRWIGLNWFANLLDKRMQKRAERRQEDLRYREEFDTLSDEQKKEMKKLRKEEKKAKKEAEKAAKLAKKQENARIKQQKKIEKLAKALEKAQQQMNKLEGKPVTTKEEPKTEPKKQEKKKVTKKKKPKTNEKTKKKVKVKPKEKTNQQQIELQELPLQQQQQPPEQQIQQPTEQTQQQQTEAPLIDNDVPAATGNLIDTEAFPETVNNDNVPTFDFTAPIKQQNDVPAATGNLIDTEAFQQTITNDNVPTFDFTAPIEQQIDGNAKEVHMDNLVDRPPDLDENKVSMQTTEREKQTTLQERLVKEKQQLDAVTNWRDTLSNSLFPHAQDSKLPEEYGVPENDRQMQSDFLTGTVYGILGGNAANLAQKQEIMNKLLNGEQLGDEYTGLIHKSIQEFMDASNAESNAPLEKIMGNAMKQLSQQASREEDFSMRHAMISRLISNGAKTADSLKLKLPLNENEMQSVQGATRMGTIAQNYYNARQYLGKNPANLNDPTVKNAADYLVTGNAIKQMFKLDKQQAGAISSTQTMLGQKEMSPQNLKSLINMTSSRRNLQPEGIKNLLENPDSTVAFTLGQQATKELVPAAKELLNSKTNNLERQNTVNLENQPQINPMVNQNH